VRELLEVHRSLFGFALKALSRMRVDNAESANSSAIRIGRAPSQVNPEFALQCRKTALQRVIQSIYSESLLTSIKFAG
jgi:hypothetical protein